MNLRKETLEELTKEELIGTVLVLSGKILELEEKILSFEKDSSNSSKPPSSDIYKPEKESKTSRQRRKKKKKHIRKTRLQVSDPTHIIPCEPSTCEDCGTSLTEQSGTVVGRRQEVDIPPIEPIVREFQLVSKACDCGHCNVGQYPQGINAPVQLGSTLKAFLIYLKVVQLIPFQRLKQLCADLFNFDICKRSIENALEKGYQESLPLYKQIMNRIQKATWMGSDETGYRVNGKRWWMWVWHSAKAVYYAVNQSRGYQVVKEHFGETYQGAAVHDCFSAQNNTKASRGHQQCHCHLDRAAQFLIDKHRSEWAYRVQKLLLASQRAREKIYDSDFDPQIRQKVIQSYEQQLLELINTTVEGKAVLRFQKRLRKQQNAILFFMHHPDVPFHNNGAERAIRMAKVQQKISGGHRSEHGANRQAVLLSVVETAKRNHLNLLDAIKKLLNGSLVFN